MALFNFGRKKKQAAQPTPAPEAPVKAAEHQEAEPAQKFVTAEQVFVGQQIASRDDALHFLAKQGAALGFAASEADVYDAFVIREGEGPTGLEHGFAIPHAKAEAITKAGVIVLKLAAPVEWPSFDDVPVDICLALLVPGGEAGTTHIKLLSTTAVMLMDDKFRDFLRNTDDPEAIAAEINTRLAA